jgi:hypothetical protein
MRRSIADGRINGPLRRAIYGTQQRTVHFEALRNEDGTAFIDLSRATREQMAAVSVIETEEKLERTGGGRDDFENIRKIKLKMSDKLAALTLLARHQKLLTDNPRRRRGPEA